MKKNFLFLIFCILVTSFMFTPILGIPLGLIGFYFLKDNKELDLDE